MIVIALQLLTNPTEPWPALNYCLNMFEVWISNIVLLVLPALLSPLRDAGLASICVAFASVDHGIDSSRFEAFRDVLWSLIV